MSFGAPIKDNMKGLYYSKYTGVDGEERYMATTQVVMIILYLLL